MDIVPDQLLPGDYSVLEPEVARERLLHTGEHEWMVADLTELHDCVD